MKTYLIPFICLVVLSACSSKKNQTETKKSIDPMTVKSTIAAILKQTSLSKELVAKGVKQTADLWQEENGSKEEFQSFCLTHFCKDAAEKEKLFQRFCHNFETIYGHNNRVSIEMLRPSHVVGYEKLSVDDMFAAYNGLAHFSDDMFANKIAFIITLNFPFYTLEEKTQLADTWSDTEWGYA
ncbi:MAG: hypothetical protein PHO77_07775, partial [Bacteroidales bacterium]|nr:hypothetical protein [Bacteroidales bacterium]